MATEKADKAKTKKIGKTKKPVVPVEENIHPAMKDLIRPLKGLMEDPKNARTHDERSIDSLMRSLRTHGQMKPIAVMKGGVIIAGNGTFRAAQKLGWKNLAVVEYEGKEAAARAYAVADNRTAELSMWDEGALGENINEIIDAMGDDFDAQDLGFSEDELGKLLGLNEDGEDESDFLDDKAEGDDDTGGEDGSTEVQDDGRVAFSVTLTPAQNEKLYKAIAKAKKLKGGDVKTTAQALDLMADVFLDAE